MEPLNLTALFLDGEDGQRLAEVNGLPASAPCSPPLNCASSRDN
ncbi:hypothetical protein ACV35O_31500 [Pseudomonas aeruginosa]